MRETAGPLMLELTGEIRSAGPENRPGGLPLGTLPISPHNARANSHLGSTLNVISCRSMLPSGPVISWLYANCVPPNNRTRSSITNSWPA